MDKKGLSMFGLALFLNYLTYKDNTPIDSHTYTAYDLRLITFLIAVIISFEVI